MELGFFAFLILVAMAVSQGILVIGLLKTLLRFRQGNSEDGRRPRTAMILCLRGRDPFLENCLELAMQQTHADYQLRIVVDNRSDPAWEVARAMVERYGESRVSVETLEDRLDTCSLKCSSLVQAIGNLDASFQTVALVDADTMPYAAWLSDLNAALADEHVGAATGNRWYMPASSSWGALVRYLWNAAAIVQMYWYEVPWGGTLAIKRKVIDDLKLLDRWRRSLCEDTMLFHQLGKQGLRVKFVPSLMMVNREDCGLFSCLAWIRRQLLTMRLYHPLWPLVLVHGIGTPLVLLAAVVMTVVATIRQDWSMALGCGGGVVAYEMIMLGLLILLEMAVRRVIRSQGGATKWLSFKTILRLAPAIVLTQIVYTFALLGAQFAKNVSWRGITYRVDGSWDLHRLNDSLSYSESECDANAHSL